MTIFVRGPSNGSVECKEVCITIRSAIAINRLTVNVTANMTKAPFMATQLNSPSS